jgi:hypothetical protein
MGGTMTLATGVDIVEVERIGPVSAARFHRRRD